MSSPNSKGIHMYVYTHADFPRRVALEHNTRMEEEPEASRVRRLVILKEAMRAVSKSIGNDLVGQTQADDLEDKLGVAIKFIRASENVSLKEISSCITRYPYISLLWTIHTRWKVTIPSD